MNYQQNLRGLLPAAQKELNRDARLRAAWLAVPDPLHSRPTPRRPWDAAGRSECPYSPWDRIVDPLRSALRAAVRTRDPQKVKAVTIRIEAFFDEMKGDVFTDLPFRDEASILRVAIEETEAQSAGDVAIQEILAEPMPSAASLERADSALAKHANALHRCRTMIGTLLRTGVLPTSMRIAR